MLSVLAVLPGAISRDRRRASVFRRNRALAGQRAAVVRFLHIGSGGQQASVGDCENVAAGGDQTVDGPHTGPVAAGGIRWAADRAAGEITAAPPVMLVGAVSRRLSPHRPVSLPAPTAIVLVCATRPSPWQRPRLTVVGRAVGIDDASGSADGFDRPDRPTADHAGAEIESLGGRVAAVKRECCAGVDGDEAGRVQNCCRCRVAACRR